MISFRLEVVEECASSQEILLARRGAPDFHGSAVLALRQTAGYGRRGRNWESGAGNLALSFGLTLEAPAAALPLVPFAAGLAAFRAAANFLESGNLRLKWPNDLYLDGKKLGGLIAQARQLPGGAAEVVVGIGVNLAHAPEGVGQETIALAEHAAGAPEPEAFARALLAEFAAEFPPDFARLHKAWEEAAGLGQGPVYVVGENAPLEPCALLETGELLVRDSAGRERRLASEEVSLRLTPPDSSL